jgi:hypothetical protein
MQRGLKIHLFNNLKISLNVTETGLPRARFAIKVRLGGPPLECASLGYTCEAPFPVEWNASTMLSTSSSYDRVSRLDASISQILSPDNSKFHRHAVQRHCHELANKFCPWLSSKPDALRRCQSCVLVYWAGLWVRCDTRRSYTHSSH